jgi:beta-glucosidase
MDMKDVLKKLTIDEKINFTSGHNMWKLLGHEKLGLSEIFLADGPHGVRVYKDLTKDLMLEERNLAESTLFPIAASMASTFNEDLIYGVGKRIARECNMNNVDVLLGPGVNLKRSPLGGRNFEYYSEDPYLTSRMAINFINGVQSEHVGACIKHFALNEQETNRRFVNTVVDERTMHELYLMPFRKAIEEAKPSMIMSSYNRINGHYASENRELLVDILRDNWNFEGVVVSDWGAVQNKPKSLQSGINLEMPGPSEFDQDVYQALESGEVTEEMIDESLIPLLKLEQRVKENPNKDNEYNLNHHHEYAYQVASEAVVLLENDGILPLCNDVLKIGLIGDFIKNPRINGGGSATLKPFIKEVPFDEFSKVFDVEYAQGYQEEQTSEELLEEVKEVCKNNEIVVFYTGTTASLETEGKDRAHMNLPDGHLEVFDVIKNYAKQIIVVLNNGSAINVSPLIGYANAIIEGWLLGSANGKVMVDIITGKINPSGRLSETFPLNIETTPFYREFPSLTDDVNYMGDLLRVGYRYYDTYLVDVMYPFGYGLSYSRFHYSDLKLDQTELSDEDKLLFSVKITNDSDISGYEVVQVYIHDVESFYPRPYKELKAFQKVYVEAHETKEVFFTLDKEAFAVYAVDFGDFRVESGLFNIMVGRNVNDIVLSKEITFHSNIPLRNSLTLDHPMKNFFQFKLESVAYLEEEYHAFPWYEIEEPAIRVLKRMKKRYGISDKKYQEIIDKMLK